MFKLKDILMLLLNRFKELGDIQANKAVRFFLYTILILFFLIFFAPKEQLYFYLEQKLQDNKIVIYQEKVQPTNIGIVLKDGLISYNKIFIRLFSDLSIGSYWFKTNITINNFFIDKDYKFFIPSKIDKIDISHSLLNPLNVIIVASGEFGKLNGSYDLISNKLKLNLTPSETMKTKKELLKFMLKTKDGYKYEK